MAMSGIGAIRTTVAKCRHRRSWVVTHLEALQGTGSTHYARYRQCRRCGEYLQRLD